MSASKSKYPKNQVPRTRKMLDIQAAMQDFFAQHKGRSNFRLPHLWENWPMVMGDPLWQLAQPLGVQDKALLIGAEDSMLLHELSFHTPEILSRANAFMDEVYFEKVRLELLRGRRPLYPLQAVPAPAIAPCEPRPRPANLGSLRDKIDPASPVGRAYLSYLQFFEAE